MSFQEVIRQFGIYGSSNTSVTETQINLNNKNVIYLLPYLHKFKNLKSLTLAWCNIPSLPDNIGKLKLLEELNLFGTQISLLPESLFDLINLKDLNISNTNISQISSNISKLVNLQSLDLSMLQLININNDLNNLTSLTNLHSLSLESVGLNEIPLQIFCQFTNLRFLDLTGNRISDIPIGILNLNKLEKFNLMNNLLTALPIYLIYMQPMKMLYDNNVLLHPAVYRWLYDKNAYLPLTQEGHSVALKFADKYMQHYAYNGILQTKKLFQDFRLRLMWDELVDCKRKCDNKNIHIVLRLTFEELFELLLIYQRDNNNFNEFKKKLLQVDIPYTISKIQ